MDKQYNAAAIDLRGTMGGIKLFFPQIYYNSVGVHYGDDKRWFAARRDKPYTLPTQDLVIRDFMLVLNRSTFEPICTFKDLSSYAGNYRSFTNHALPSRATRWLQFTFEFRMYSEGQGSLKYLFDRELRFADAKIGPLRTQGVEFGLIKLSSEKEGGQLLDTEIRPVYDTFYHDPEWQTLILCRRLNNTRALDNLSCVHYFIVPNLRAVAVGYYLVMDDVSDWKVIETEFTRRAGSFVMKD